MGSLNDVPLPGPRSAPHTATQRVAGRAASIPSAALVPPLPDTAAVLGPQRTSQHARPLWHDQRHDGGGASVGRSQGAAPAGGRAPGGRGPSPSLGGAPGAVDARPAGSQGVGAPARASWPVHSALDLQRCAAAAMNGDSEALVAAARFARQQPGGVQRLLELGMPVDVVSWLAGLSA